VPNWGVRNAGPVFGKLDVPPLVVFLVVGGLDDDGPEQALKRMASSIIPKVVTFHKNLPFINISYLLSF
jgi:hypothetical protein